MTEAVRELNVKLKSLNDRAIKNRFDFSKNLKFLILFLEKQDRVLAYLFDLVLVRLTARSLLLGAL